jgi:transposase
VRERAVAETAGHLGVTASIDATKVGKLLDWACTTLHIVRKPEGWQGFAVIPRRWSVERTLAWLAADSAPEAMIRWASPGSR